jgi:HEPN domain-containing protein
MTPQKQERLFRKEYSVELLAIAKDDFRTAQFLFRGFKSAEIRAENLFYACQQSIEKALKSVLCHYEIPIPLVHDLGILVAKLPAISNPQFGYEIDSLSEFAGVRRYELGKVDLSVEEAEEVLQLNEFVLNWAGCIVGK